MQRLFVKIGYGIGFGGYYEEDEILGAEIR